MDVRELWQKMLDELETMIPALGFDTLMETTAPVNVTDNKLILCTYSEISKALVQKRFLIHIREAMQPITRRQNDTSAYSAFNGIYVGGGISVPGSIYSIGQWSAVLSNVTEDSMHLSFGQSESDYGVIMTLYRQPNGSYCGYGQPDGWEGYSYITIWIESNNRISLTVSGTADSIGTEILYRSNNF